MTSRKRPRVLLVQPAFTGDRHKSHFQHHDSLAVGYLAASLKQCGIPVRTLDCEQFPRQQVKLDRAVRRGDYDLLAISTHSHKGFEEVVQLVREAKRWQPDRRIVLGGYTATLAAEAVLDEAREVDFILKGEGEESLVELVRALERGDRFDGIPGITYRRRDGELVDNRPARITDIDALPFPLRPYLPEIRRQIQARSRYLGIITSRGCNQSCTFCSVSSFYFRTSKIRRSVENVVQEIDGLYHEWGARKLKFYDESFVENNEEDIDWMHRFCDRLVRDYPGLEYFAQFRTDIADRPLLEKMVRSGMNEAFIGVESGVQTHLDRWGKANTRDDNERCLSWLRSMGVQVYLGFIMLTPTSRLEEIRRNFEWLRWSGSLRRDNLVNRLNVYRGTPIHTELRRQGLLLEAPLANVKAYSYDDPRVGRLAGTLDTVKEIFGPALRALDMLENNVYNLKSQTGADKEDIRSMEQRLAGMRQEELETWTALVDLALQTEEQGVPVTRLEEAAQRSSAALHAGCRRSLDAMARRSQTREPASDCGLNSTRFDGRRNA